MALITKYTIDDGIITVVVQGVELGNDETQLLDYGLTVKADIKITNPFEITVKQRKKIFALCNDIEEHTGQPREYMRKMFQDYTKIVHGYEEDISLSNCSKEVASQIIEVIISWTFIHDIPLNHKTSDLLKDDKSFLYAATLNRRCVICGKHAQLAHREAVGSGRNRRTMDHYNHHVLALCHDHHALQHQIGVESFDKRFALQNSWLKVDEKLNKMLKGQ